MSIQIEETLQDTFREKCKSEKLKYSEVAEALLQAYVNDEINVSSCKTPNPQTLDT